MRTMHFLGPDSVKAARVAAGAQQQNKLWSFVETFYANQGTENSGYVTDDFLKDVATTAGVNADAALQFADTNDAEAALTTANQRRAGRRRRLHPDLHDQEGRRHRDDPRRSAPATSSAALEKAL